MILNVSYSIQNIGNKPFVILQHSEHYSVVRASLRSNNIQCLISPALVSPLSLQVLIIHQQVSIQTENISQENTDCPWPVFSDNNTTSLIPAPQMIGHTTLVTKIFFKINTCPEQI